MLKKKIETHQQKSIICHQLNFKKNLAASIEYNKSSLKYEKLLCFATEPYIAFEKVGNLGRNLKSYPTTKSRPRASFIFTQNIRFVGIDKLTSRDCAAGFITLDGKLTVVASVYCDITKDMIQPFLRELLEFVRKEKYPLILCLDSNAHSTLYGNENNKRGDLFEEFILENSLDVLNIPGSITFEAVRGNVKAASCIDVTLARNASDVIKNWRVINDFNASDHKTIRFELEQEIFTQVKTRNFKKADWDLFKEITDKAKFYFPSRLNKKKLDKMVQSLYKVINKALDKACPLRAKRSGRKDPNWFTAKHKSLRKKSQKSVQRVYKLEIGVCSYTL